MQGNWGEMVLETVLERSGLRKGEEYVREQVHQDDGGKTYRPDVIINLPEGKHIVVAPLAMPVEVPHLGPAVDPKIVVLIIKGTPVVVIDHAWQQAHRGKGRGIGVGGGRGSSQRSNGR